MCTTFRFTKSYSFAGDSLTRSVISSIKLAFDEGTKRVSATSKQSRTLIIPPPQSSCRRFRPPNPRKGCKLFPSLQTNLDTLPLLWVWLNLLLGPSYDVRHAPPRISCCRAFLFHQASHGSLETALSFLFSIPAL